MVCGKRSLELQSLIRRGFKTDDDQGRFDYFDANYNWKVSTCSHCGKVLVYEFSQREIPQYESYLSIEAIKEVKNEFYLKNIQFDNSTVTVL